MPLQQTKELVRKIGDNPALIDQLMAESPAAKKKTLEAAGIRVGTDRGLSRAELTEDIERILISAARKEGAQVGSPERLVEWIGAIAGAAAGAMAA
jgi:hypothetical protein